MNSDVTWDDLRFENNALAGSAVHYDTQGHGELQMTNAALFFDRRLLGQPLPVDRSFTGIGVHGEISHLKRGQILKKVAAL